MDIVIKDKETQERIYAMWHKVIKHYRTARLHEARAKIARGKGDIFSEMFWKEIEKIFPETKDTSNWEYDPVENKIKKES
jgi:hypothetical protein